MINNMLKDRRLELGLTMKQVAEAVGVSEGTISRWESGEISNMKRSRIAALAKVLKMQPSDLVLGTSNAKTLEDQLPIETVGVLSEEDKEFIKKYSLSSKEDKEFIRYLFSATEEEQEMFYNIIKAVKKERV